MTPSILGKRLRLAAPFDGLPEGTEFDVNKIDFDPLTSGATRGLYALLDSGEERHWRAPADGLSVTIVGNARKDRS